MACRTLDQEAREEALQPTGSFVVEAPAGSGKTDLLIARYLSLLSRVSHPYQILAVTYTRKAAVEMKNRILQKLTQAQEATMHARDSSWEGLLLSLAKQAVRKHSTHPAILFNPESLRIGTFHSFCASLLRGWPVESEIPPGLPLLDDPAQEDLLQKAVERHIRSLLSQEASEEEKEAYTNRLASVNNDHALLADQLKDLLRRRDRLKDFPLSSLEKRTDSLESDLNQRLETLAGFTLGKVQDYFLDREDSWDRLKKALMEQKAAAGDILPEAIPGKNLKDLGEWKRVAAVFLTKGGTLRRSFGPQYGFPKGFREDPAATLIKNLPSQETKRLASIANWPEGESDSLGIGTLKDILILAGGALKKLWNLLQTQGIDYLELEMGALRALRQTARPGESLIFHHEHLRHILVDEAQDLNDIQLDILSRLTEGWEPGDGRTVFAVGDPKQSIYRFRRAEISLFYELMERGIPRKSEAPFPLKPLLLQANFRSRPHLIGFANRLFARVMASPRREFDEVVFSNSQPAREEPDRTLPTRAALFNGKTGVPSQGLSPREREARWVATEVLCLHRNRPGETIAILIPTRTYLPVFVRALADLEVPLCLLEGEPMGQRPEVNHLLNLFTAMVRPYDDLAWAGTLKAPWVRSPNQVLVELRGGNGFWSRRILSGNKASLELGRFPEAIAEAQKMFGRESYRTTLSRLWEDLDGPIQTAVRYGPAGVSNARAFFDLLDQCSGMPGEEALARLKRLLQKAYTPPDPKGAFSTVSMMTIHKAKGLEFDHVFVVDLGYDPLRGGRQEQPPYRMERLPGEGNHYLIAATADRRTAQHNLGSYLLKELNDQRSLAEAKRLFYVAATRAKESLTLTGTGNPPKEVEEEAFKTPLSSLQTILKTGGDDFEWLVNPMLSAPAEVEKRAEVPQGIPPPFAPEPLPYQVTSPSRIEDETSMATEPGTEEEEGYARARGVVIHRIMETLARGQPIPGPEAVSIALATEGIPLKEAEAIAPQVRGEAIRAWEEPDFTSLRQHARQVHPEWAVEDFDGRSVLRVGRFDLLLEMEDRWVLIDYKTGRPDKEVGAWLETQAVRHQSQLNAYAQMVGRMLRLPEDKIEWVILFTALPRFVREIA